MAKAELEAVDAALTYDAEVRGGLRVRRGAEELKIKVPCGCALYCTNEILQLEHAHGANGRCLSWVIEVSRPIRPAARPSRAPFLLCQMEVVNRDLTTPGGEDCSYEILITAYGTIHRTRCTSTTTPFLWDVHVSRRTVAFPGVALHGTMT